MSFIKKLFIFVFVNNLSTGLISIASFLSVESVFKKIILLSIALSLKTLWSSIFSYNSNFIIRKYGVKKSFISSQLFGIMALIILFLGFYFKFFLLAVFGIMMTGIPTTFVSILMTMTLKYSCENESIYRKYSGSKELISGLAVFIGVIITPVLLLYISLNEIILIDSLLFIFSIIFLYKIELSNFSKENIPIKESFKNVSFKDKNSWIFFLQTLSSLLLVAIIPLCSASDKISLTSHLPKVIREWIWCIDSIMLISASLIYLIAKSIRKIWWLDYFLMLSSLLLVPLIFTRNYIVLISVLFLISFSASVSFLKFRDDYILTAEKNRIQSYSILSVFQLNFIAFISPIIIGYLFTKTKINSAILVMFCTQFVVCVIYFLLKKYKKIFVFKTDRLSN